MRVSIVLGHTVMRVALSVTGEPWREGVDAAGEADQMRFSKGGLRVRITIS